MLKMALEYTKTLGIEKVMIGCFSDNIPSIKTIEKCGGVFSETKILPNDNLINLHVENEKSVNIYWIDLKTLALEEMSDFCNKKNTVILVAEK
jgi:predicted acetyltransferase